MGGGDLMALTEVNSLGIKDLEVKTGDIAADAITGAKIADDQIDSEHYIDGSVDHAHLAGDCIDGDNIQDDVINSEHIAAGAIDNEHLADDAVDSDELAAGSVDIAHLANGTDGQIITWNASGVAAVVGPGTDGQVLTSTGAGSPPAFEAVPAGGAALSNDANNRVVTADGSGGINGEAGLTCDGTHLSITDGNLVIATAGHGVDFSATGNSSTGTMSKELLDFYEEGTWAPQMWGNVQMTMTGAHGVQDGKYTRVGNVVTVYFRLGWTDQNSASGSLTIRNFPFTAKSNSGGYYFSGIFLDFWGEFPSGDRLLQMAGGETKAYIQSTSAASLCQVSDLGGGNGGFSGSMTYLCND